MSKQTKPELAEPGSKPDEVPDDELINQYGCSTVPVRKWGKNFKRRNRRLHRAHAAHAKGLLAWARHYLPAHFRLPPSRMHLWLAEQLDRAVEQRGVKLNLIGPRGSAKSTVATLAYVLRCAVERQEAYIWILSDTKHQAAAHLNNVRMELLENRRLRSDYHEIFVQPPEVQGNIIRIHDGPTIEAYGTGQHIRGKRRREHRPTLIVCDDLQNDDHIRSSWQRERSREWFQGTLLKAGTKITNIVNLATALHRDALALELDRTPGWNSAIFKAIEHWPTNMTLWHAWEQIYSNLEDPNRLDAARAFYDEHLVAMQEDCKLLWPEEEDLYTLMRMRVEGGRVAFEREKQGSPFDPSLCEWPKDYFDDPLWFDDWPAKLQTRVITLDPSKGRDARRGDYSAFVVLGVGLDGVLYVEADLARRATPQMVADGVELVRQFRPDAFGVEANQFQELLGEHFVAEFQKQRMHGIKPWLIDNQVNKLVRIRRLGPLLSGKRMRFKAGSPGTKQLVEQLREFPIGDHDDGPDALEMAVRLAADMLQTPVPRNERMVLSV